MGCTRLHDDRSRPCASADGFTLVELVSVLLLIGVLSVVAMSRLVNASAFAPALAAQELVALSRLAQQEAQSRRDAAVSMDVVADGDDWRFRVRVTAGGVPVDAREQRVERRNTTIAARNGSTSVALAAMPLALTFDGLGGLAGAAVGATVLDPAAGIELTVGGDATYSICIGPTGHAYRGTCG